MPALGNLLRTSTFRLAAIYLVLFSLSVGAILAYVYWNTAGLLERQIDATIETEIQGLAEQYRRGGFRLLVDSIEQRSRRNDEGLYLFADILGIRLAGNMGGVPGGISGSSGWIEFPYLTRTDDDERHHQARAYFTRLGGFILIVGRDVEEHRQLAQLIRQALYWALGLTALFGLGGGILMSRTLLSRVDQIAATSRSIMGGDLSERMPVRGTGDELDRLAQALNEMLDQIERLMTGMREVSDNVAHDLKTPLTRMRARVEDALRSGSTETYRDALEQTLEESDSLLHTFNALLEIARTEAGQARSALAPCDAGEVVRELAELYGPLIEEAGGRLDVGTDASTVVKGDRQLLARAVANLLDNALKYAETDPGSNRALEIALAARRTDDEVSIEVADNGPGIPEADREHVTERFVRLDTSRTKPGSGLGLSLVAGVAKLHGGRLELADNAPGLRASIVIPALQEAA